MTCQSGRRATRLRALLVEEEGFLEFVESILSEGASRAFYNEGAKNNL